MKKWVLRPVPFTSGHLQRADIFVWPQGCPFLRDVYMHERSKKLLQFQLLYIILVKLHDTWFANNCKMENGFRIFIKKTCDYWAIIDQHGQVSQGKLFANWDLIYTIMRIYTIWDFILSLIRYRTLSFIEANITWVSKLT